VWVGPLGLGSPRPIACARYRFQGWLIEQTVELGFIFENGRLSDVFNPNPNNPALGGAFAGALTYAVTCGKLTYGPFPELVKKR
jgi:hypothetical protein